jgi:hypothetical protein
MPRSIDSEKALKTATVLGLVNLVVAVPFYSVRPGLALAMAIGVSSFMLYHFHELGKERRPGSNLINKANNFFSTYTKDPNTNLINAAKNIVNGGAAIYDDASATCIAYMRR